MTRPSAPCAASEWTSWRLTSRSGYPSLPSRRACGHMPHSGASHFESVASLAPSVDFGTMGRDTPTPVRGRSGSVSSSQLADRSRSPLQRRPPSGQRCTLTPRTTCRLREAPHTGTPRSQRQRAPSPCRVKCESPRDPEKRHRAWLRGDSLASPVPPPFGEVRSGSSPPATQQTSPRRRRLDAAHSQKVTPFRCVGITI